MAGSFTSDKSTSTARTAILAFSVFTAVNLFSELVGLETFYFASLLLSVLFFKNGALLTLVSLLILAAMLASYFLSSRSRKWLLIGLGILCADAIYITLLLLGLSSEAGYGRAIFNLLVDLIIHLIAVVFILVSLFNRKGQKNNEQKD